MSWRTAFAAAAATAVAATAVAVWALTRADGTSREGAGWEYVQLFDSAGVNLNFPALALSPDGNAVVFRDNITDTRLWIKSRGELEPRQLPGTERAQNPAFSPDGQWVAFIADGRLKKVGVRGGASVTLADSALSGFGGVAWLDDGSIIYVAPSQFELRKVSAAGGSYTVAFRDTALGGRGIGNPSALPDSRGVLYELCSSGCVTSSLYAVDFRSGKPKVVLEDAVQGWYLPTGHVLYVRRDGAALVAPFDVAKLEISGGAVPVLESVAGGAGFAQLAWSRSGALVYVSGGARARDNTVVRVSRSGLVTPIDTAWAGQFNSIALSPDGRRLALGVGLGTSALNIWIKQLDRGPFTRLSFGGRDRRPEWSPDGKMVAFIRDTLTTGIAVVRPSDGTGSDRPLLRVPQQLQEIAWSRDGEWVVVRTDNAGPGAGDLIGVRMRGDTTPVPLVASAFTELNPAVSPDGRWLAYGSNESGRAEVYVRPFPMTSGGLFQVSLNGGGQPRWSRDGSELFFIGQRGEMTAARIRTSPSFEVVGLQPLFSTSSFILDVFHQSYDVTSDGGFIFTSTRQLPGARAPRVVRVDNWFSDLRARLPR